MYIEPRPELMELILLLSSVYIRGESGLFRGLPARVSGTLLNLDFSASSVQEIAEDIAIKLDHDRNTNTMIRRFTK